MAEKYRVSKEEELVSPEEVFAEINKKYTKAGALLRGIRAHENMSRIDFAKRLRVTYYQLSQMKNGKRSVDIKLAKRIEKLFGLSHRAFLE